MSVAPQPESLEREVRKALADLSIKPADGAAVELALTYAREIDAGGDLAKLGPALLATLTALRMTPAARAAAVKGGQDAGPPASPLDELRARRAKRSG